MMVNRPPRVRIACTQCSNAKLRCDLNRPCLRCCQRGTADKCHDRPMIKKCSKRRPQSQTCRPCRKAKVSCKSQERPCPRCIRLNLDCRRAETPSEDDFCLDCCYESCSLIPNDSYCISSNDEYPSLSASFVVAIFQCLFRYSTEQLACFMSFPEKLDHISKITCAFLRLGDRLQIRQWLCENFIDVEYKKYEYRRRYLALEQHIEQTQRIYRQCSGPILLHNNNLPVIQYIVDYNDPSAALYTLALNPLAESLLRCSSTITDQGVLAKCMAERNSPDSGFIPVRGIIRPQFVKDSFVISDLFWRLFPYTSWEDILYWMMDIIVLGLPSAEFAVELITNDGVIVVANSIWRILLVQDVLLVTIVVTDSSYPNGIDIN